MSKFRFYFVIMLLAILQISVVFAAPDIFDIVKKGDIDSFNRVRTRISDYNTINSNGDSLAIAAVKGYIAYKRSQSGTTALHLAASVNDTATVKLLLSKGASVSVWDEKGRTAYSRALKSRSYDSAKALLAAMGSSSTDAVEVKFSNIVEELLKEGVPVNLSDSSGKSLLVYAVQSDSPAIVQTVLKHNPDLSYRQTPFGPTALHYAVSGSNPVIIRLLVSAGADINAITRNADYRPAPFESSSAQANRYKKPVEYNLKIEVYSDKKDPAQDRRCFYKVYINKVESGRTVTGLESQKKSFTTSVDINRHHISVVKYVLDERQGKYIKLNNIHQPRPSAFYTDTAEGRIRVVSIIHNEDSETSYYEDYEKE